MATLQTITAFHALRQNDWPKSTKDQEAAVAKAIDYQRAFYPVRATLSDAEQADYDDALALLALEMLSPLPVRASQNVKKRKEASSTGASEEVEYEASTGESFPQIAALLAPLAPRPISTGVRFSRMRP